MILRLILLWLLFTSVPGYRPVAYGNGADDAQSSVWRGRAVDPTGWYYFHYRYYITDSGQWSSHDPSWDDRNPTGQTVCGGDLINYFDLSGLMGKAIGPDPLAQFQEQTADYLQSHYGELPGSQQPSGSQVFSSMVDMIPVIGGLKMWYELGTGFDTVTGQHIDSSDWAQVAMIGLSFVPLAAEAAPEEAALESQVNIPFYGIGSKETQLEFDLVNDDLSGKLTNWETSPGNLQPPPANTATGQGGLNLYKFGDPTSTKATGWSDGDYFLYLPNQGSPAANWAQNSSALRSAMAEGNPINDSYIDPVSGEQIMAGQTPTSAGRFLNAERQLLENHGWKYNPKTGAYHSPQ